MHHDPMGLEGVGGACHFGVPLDAARHQHGPDALATGPGVDLAAVLGEATISCSDMSLSGVIACS